MSIKGLEIFDGNLLIQRDKAEETVKGIIMPDQAKRAKESGTVVLAAEKMKDGSPARFTKGDRVRFNQHMVGNFCNVEVDGETYLLIPSHWVWARESR